MKLFACIVTVFTVLFLQTASAQKVKSPKKPTDTGKADTAKQSVFLQMASEFDYFGNTSDSIKKTDRVDENAFNEFINQLDSADRTVHWLQQNAATDVFVTTASPVFNTDFYNGFAIAPRQAKTLHLNITGSLFSSSTYNPVYIPFYLQVKNKNTVLAELLVQGRQLLNISLPTTDSVFVFFIAHPPENDKAHFHCEWSIGDTAAYSYAGQSPETVFDKMLELAPNQCNNIHLNDKGLPGTIYYPGGLFASLPAERGGMYFHVTQYTGKKLASGKAADKINAIWNKKISDWLKYYAITNVTKTTSGDAALKTDTEITTYTKKNAVGKILFTIKVFKEQDGEGTEADPVVWNTGVSIY